jgi:hypothetical protein
MAFLFTYFVIKCGRHLPTDSFDNQPPAVDASPAAPDAYHTFSFSYVAKLEMNLSSRIAELTSELETERNARKKVVLDLRRARSCKEQCTKRKCAKIQACKQGRATAEQDLEVADRKIEQSRTENKEPIRFGNHLTTTADGNNGPLVSQVNRPTIGNSASLEENRALKCMPEQLNPLNSPGSY